MAGGRPGFDSVRKDGTRFSFGQFTKLIASTTPKYSLFILGILLLAMSSGVQIYVPQLASSLVNSFSEKMDYIMLLNVILLFIASSLVSAIGGTVLGVFGENIIQNLRKNLWLRLTTLKVKYFDTVKSGEISSCLVNDTSQVKQLLANTFPQTISSLILVVGSIYMMIQMDWHMSLAMLIVIPVVFLVMMSIMTFGTKVGHIRQDALARFSGVASETISEIRLVKTSNAEKQAQERANQEVNRLFRVGKKEAVFDAAMQPFMMMIMMSMVFGLLGYGMHRIALGVMSIGTLMSFLMYLFNLMGSLPSIAALFSEMAKAAGSTKRVHQMLCEEPENLWKGQEVDLTGKALSVEHVEFAYEQNAPVLHNLSFAAEPDQIIAFAGPSGGGKSTIFSLLERFYDLNQGVIKFDDIEISDINLSNYRSQIGFVSQDCAIMAGTIRENLTYGLQGTYTDEELWKVLELAYARTFVEAMADGLDTEVGERGVKISGGQRQRIAVARAFLRNPKILMLDEATASLDSESEMMVQKALANLMKGRTTLVIAHRLATIVDSDKIYFIEHGTVTGSGRHDDLVKQNKTYAKYVSEQFRTENPAFA